MYPNKVIELSKKIKPSKRAVSLITDLNNLFLKEKLELIWNTFWFDTGSFEFLYEASQLIRIMEKRIGYKIGCPEEISFNKNCLFWNEKISKKFAKFSKNQNMANIFKRNTF